jgi:hypothetical protein
MVEFHTTKKMSGLQQAFHPFDTLASGTNVPSLASVFPALLAKTVIGGENNCPSAQRGERLRLEDGPANGTVADIEGEL